MDSKTERWLSVDEIAVHLGVSKETVYRWVEKQKIPAHKLGKLWKFQASEVDQWVRDGGGATSQNHSPNEVRV
ncbi:MAG: helix-turn-helix domain-containing protein [Bdellovibrionota bacterium]